MNLETILKNIHAQLEIAPLEIDLEDDETIARISLANIAIDTWAKVNNTRWNELYTTELTDSITEGDNTFKLDDKFRMLDSVVLASSGRKLEVKNARKTTKPGDYVYIEGNPRTGYELKFGKEITETDTLLNQKLRIGYYKNPTFLVNLDDVPEMLDPSFIVDYVAAAVSSDDDPNKYAIFSTSYSNKLINMVDSNDQIADGEDSTVWSDDDLVIGG